MARHKAFDRQLVLDKAMQVFWQYGYEATSVQTLLDAMGINRGSLYDTFGDKRSLFLEAIAHYESQVLSAAIAKLNAPDAGKATIIEHFQGVMARLTNDRARWGCLMTNVAVERCNQDTEANQRIHEGFCQIEAAFRHALGNAQARGEISPQADVSAIAGFLTCTMQGLRVMIKVNYDLWRRDRASLEHIITTALSVLDAP